MKVLVATKDMQGQRTNDFSFTNEGELVMLPLECDGEDAWDGSCGCKRSMSGFDTHKGTTTVKVIDVPFSASEFQARYIASMRDAGWFPKEGPLDEESAKLAREEVRNLLGLASLLEAGTVLERRGLDMYVRVDPSGTKS